MRKLNDGRPVSGLVRSGLLAVGLASGVFAAQPHEQNLSERDTFSMKMGPQKRHIQHWKRGMQVRNGFNQYWLVADPVNGAVRIAEMAQLAGFKVRGVHADQDKAVYQIELSKSLDEVQAKLKSFDEFFSLEPVYAEDRIDQSLRREKAERIQKKWARSATDERDPLQDTVRVNIAHRFSSDAEALMWAKRQGIRNIGVKSKTEVEGDIVWGQLESVSEASQVQSITPFFKGGPINDISRSTLGLRSLQFGAASQGFLDTISAFSSTWNQAAASAGKGVFVGVFDGGVDDRHPDLRISSTQNRRAPLTGETWKWGTVSDNISHGSHVAGSILGNGSLSSAKGGRAFQWRGIAPLAQIFSLEPDANPHAVDVGNFSWLSMGVSGEYTDYAKAYDNLIADHTLNRRPVYVFAVGNNGTWNPSQGNQVGYFSTLNALKNGIRVGASDREGLRKAPFSSMGPTRDGRLGPEVMAPGAGVVTPGSISVAGISVNRGGVARNFWDPLDNAVKPTAVGVGRDLTNNGSSQTFRGGQFFGYRKSLPATQQWTLAAGDEISCIVAGSVALPVSVVLVYSDGSMDEIRTGDLSSSFQSFNVTVSSTLLASAIGKTIIDVAVVGDFTGPSIGSVGVLTDPTTGVVSYSYQYKEGTSMAAPMVTGIVALMHERFMKLTKRPHTDHMWNSTAKAILVHTAKDMVSLDPTPGLLPNEDFKANAADKSAELSDVYGVGPDWATGFGLVDAQKAVGITGTSKVLEENLTAGSRAYSVTIPTGQTKFRATLAWDDPGSNRLTLTGADPALVNDLDLVMISPSGQVFRPWVLDHTIINDGVTNLATGIDPKVTLQKVRNNPAKRGIDRLNNLEVVDLSNPQAGVWTIVVVSHILRTSQDFSLVTDIAATAVSSYATLPTGAKGLRFQDPTGGLAELSVSGTLYLKNCNGTSPVSGGFGWSFGGGLKASLLRTSGFRATRTDVNQLGSLSSALIQPGGIVVYNPAGDEMFRIGQDGIAQVSGAMSCNTAL